MVQNVEYGDQDGEQCETTVEYRICHCVLQRGRESIVGRRGDTTEEDTDEGKFEVPRCVVHLKVTR